MKKMLLLMVFVAISWQNALAQTFTSAGLVYNVISTNTVEVGLQNSATIASTISIPATVSRNSTVYAVKSIGESAFEYCDNVRSVTIANSVTIIGNNAFYYCTNLSSLTIPNALTSIGDSAFRNCENLTSFAIPNSVTSIADGTFIGCSRLTSVTIPNSVTSIGQDAFNSCSGLTSITIPNSVTSIGDLAFNRCTGLTSITIPNGVTSIGGSTFVSCISLTTVNLPANLTSIGYFAFSNCRSLTSVIIPNSVTTLSKYAFSSCYSLTSVTIPSSITSMDEFVFSECNHLTSIICNLPNPLTINLNVFELVNQGACSLTVPLGSLAAYEAAPVWQNFNITNGIARPTTAPQTLCAGATIGSLTATGNALKWYTTLRGGAALATSTVLTTATYYVSQNVGGYDGPRSSSSVTINTTQPIPANTYYIQPGIQLQTVTGFDSSVHKVYATATSTTPLAGTTIFVTGTYYATNTQNSCESTRSAITIFIYNLPNITSPACGSRLTSIAGSISATAVPHATNYLFEVTGNGSTRSYYSPTNYFNFTQLQGSTVYNTAYSIRVAAGFSGQYGNFGSACSINTPVQPALTNIVTSQCNSTLTTKWATVYCNPVIGATAYRFEWSNGGTTLTYNATSNNMQLGNYTGWALNTTYSVRVAIQYNGNWLAFGSACNLTTPASFARHHTDDQMALSIKAVPNPFETEYVLMAQGGNQTPILVSVYDMLGKQVEQFSVEASDLENRSLGTNYCSGIYNVMISQGDAQQVVRIIKK
ncbi:MAG: hypothetical protein CFE24_14250 [Flavobacterium sp. BFFFF2]|nr:MAG: hypothetical protein CFE24_14250 [Flavobacterium sp. BFFFF2]